MQPPKVHCCSKCNKIKSTNRYYVQRHEISCTGQKARRHLIKDADEIKSERKFPGKAVKKTLRQEKKRYKRKNKKMKKKMIDEEAAAEVVEEFVDSDDDELDVEVDEDFLAMIDPSLFTV